MAGVSPNHNRIAMYTSSSLAAQLQKRSCNILGSDQQAVIALASLRCTLADV